MQAKIILRPDGTVVTEGLEGRGPECLERVKILVERFGGIKKRTLKPEYDLTDTEAEKERLHE